MPAAGSGQERDGHHGRPAEARRSKRMGNYGARFLIPKALGERGERCESVPSHKHDRGSGRRAGPRRRHGRLLGARGEGSRGHIFAWEKAGEGEGKAARSTVRKSKAETAWFGRTAGGGSRRRSGGCYELWNVSRGGEESEMGAARAARARARGKKSWEREVGAGARLRPVAVSCAREKGAVGEGEEADGRARLSAAGERGGGRGWPAGPAGRK